MLPNIPNQVEHISIHTGNLLNLNELKIRAGQTPKDELLESLRLVLSKSKIENTSEKELQIDGGSPLEGIDDIEEPSVLKTSLKIFIPTSEAETIHSAIQNAMTALGNQTIDSLIVAYNDRSNSQTLNKNLETLWQVLEEYVDSGKVLRIGVSDIDTDDFISLYHNVKIKPSIIQINLSACCVVPPQLQEFTKQHDIQLLTHNDPLEILPDESLSQLFNSNSSEHKITLRWAVRYQIHVKCRGVLCSKGYFISSHKI